MWAGDQDGSPRGGISGDGVREGLCSHLEEEKDCGRGAACVKALLGWTEDGVGNRGRGGGGDQVGG